jgi:hypothetical protein
MTAKKEKKPVHTPEYIRSISERVYRLELARSAGGSDQKWKAAEADRMIEKDGDGGKKFSGRAGQYDHLTRAYLEVLEIKP